MFRIRDRTAVVVNLSAIIQALYRDICMYGFGTEIKQYYNIKHMFKITRISFIGLNKRTLLLRDLFLCVIN